MFAPYVGYDFDLGKHFDLRDEFSSPFEIDIRFFDQVQGALFYRSISHMGIGPCRYSEYRHSIQAHNLLNGLKTVHYRHLDIHSHNIGLKKGDFFYCVLSIDRLSYYLYVAVNR